MFIPNSLKLFLPINCDLEFFMFQFPFVFKCEIFLMNESQSALVDYIEVLNKIPRFQVILTDKFNL